MGDRCSGDCCREFVLTGIGRTPEQIAAFLREKNVRDGEQIADMIVPLRAIESGTILPSRVEAPFEPPGGGWIFTCRYFDTEANNCGIYSTRPAMCRDFPYGNPCEHGDRCSWDAGKLGAWPLHFHRDEPLVAGEVARVTHVRVIQTGGGDQELRLRYGAFLDIQVDCATPLSTDGDPPDMYVQTHTTEVN